MATFDAPAWFKLCAATVQLNRLAQTFRSPFGGSPQVGDVLSERWQLSALTPSRLLPESGAAEALAARLAGGYNRMRVSHPIRPEPIGSLHGSPTLYSSVAAGATSIIIANGDGINLLENASLEVDANSDGVADSWLAYTQGTTGTVTRSVVASAGVVHGTKCQRINCTGLGTGTGDRVGVYQAYFPGSNLTTPAVASASFRGTDVTSINVRIDLLLSGVVIATNLVTADMPAGGEWIRLESSCDPAGDPYDEIRILMYQSARQGAAGVTQVEFDAAQLEFGDEASDFEPNGGSLVAGDIVGLNGQWLQAAEDALGDASGRLNVTLVNRLRDAVTAGADIEWDHPTIEMATPGQVGALSYGIGVSQPLALDLEEVW